MRPHPLSHAHLSMRPHPLRHMHLLNNSQHSRIHTISLTMDSTMISIILQLRPKLLNSRMVRNGLMKWSKMIGRINLTVVSMAADHPLLKENVWVQLSRKKSKNAFFALLKCLCMKIFQSIRFANFAKINRMQTIHKINHPLDVSTSTNLHLSIEQEQLTESLIRAFKTEPTTTPSSQWDNGVPSSPPPPTDPRWPLYVLCLVLSQWDDGMFPSSPHRPPVAPVRPMPSAVPMG